MLSKIKANYTLLFGPEGCKANIDYMVEEAHNYLTPIDRRAITNLEKLRNYIEPTKPSIFNALSDKPNHDVLKNIFAN